MSKMKDYWGDTIRMSVEYGTVCVSFTERRTYESDRTVSMELDADLARKFVKKLKKAIDEVEDM